MFSRISESLRHTAAWRLSAFTTIAFALGTAVALWVAYHLVSRSIRDRSDVWLRGEIELLADVASMTKDEADGLYRLKQAAELALHEVSPEAGEEGSEEQPVFFLARTRGGEPLLWLGPRDRDSFLGAVQSASIPSGRPSSVKVPGWKHPFRVVSRTSDGGATVTLGLSDEQALELFRLMASTFTGVWAVMVLFGFVITIHNARSILRRVERITETAAQIDHEGLHRRVSVGKGKDEISRLAGTLNGMLDRIESMVEQIHVMSDSVAHDLISPVTSVRGRLELALTSGSDQEMAEAAASAIDGLDRLLRVLNATLDVAEAKAGALRLEKSIVDMGAMARELVEVYKPAAEERGILIDISIAAPAPAFVDPNLSRRALANLLDNALQHLPHGCHVAVSTRTNGDRVEIDVADDGPGFSREVREKVFERFVRGPGSQGFGVGLALVRAVTRANGGDAEVLETSGKGALIRLTFPRAGDDASVMSA